MQFIVYHLMEINIDWLIILKSSEQVFIWTLEKKKQDTQWLVGVCSVEVTILETALANISIFISMRI